MNTQRTPKILLVEDEVDIAEVVRDYLQHAGYEVEVRHDGRDALDCMRQQKLDLVILDITLPRLSGIELLRHFRGISQVPVIMLTARVEEVDRLLALEIGADDYVCKPFSPKELVARARAILRRSLAHAPGTGARTLKMDMARRDVRINGQSISLTPREFDLLCLLSRYPGRVYSRSQILQLLYVSEREVTEHAVDSHVKNLRRKLAEHAACGEWIRSVYGVGFAFDPPENEGVPRSQRTAREAEQE